MARLSLLASVWITFAAAAVLGETSKAVEPANLSKPEATLLLREYYAQATRAAKTGDIPGCVAGLTEDAHFSFNGKYFVGRSTFQAMYPKDYKDPTYRVTAINTIIQGDEIFDLVAIHGQTPGPHKAYLMFYRFELRDGKLVIPEFVSATVDEASLPSARQ